MAAAALLLWQEAVCCSSGPFGPCTTLHRSVSSVQRPTRHRADVFSPACPAAWSFCPSGCFPSSLQHEQEHRPPQEDCSHHRTSANAGSCAVFLTSGCVSLELLAVLDFAGIQMSRTLSTFRRPYLCVHVSLWSINEPLLERNSGAARRQHISGTFTLSSICLLWLMASCLRAGPRLQWISRRRREDIFHWLTMQLNRTENRKSII